MASRSITSTSSINVGGNGESSNGASSTTTRSGGHGTTKGGAPTKKTNTANQTHTSPSSSVSSFTSVGSRTSPTSRNSPSTVGVAPNSHSQSPAPSSSNKGVSRGALAGAIVASLIGAALITFLATFFFFRRRSQRRYDSRGHYQAAGAGSQRRTSRDKAAVTEKSTPNADVVGFSWLPYLPQGADDRTLQSAVKTLFDQVELHVDNFYKRDTVDMDSAIHQALARVDTGKLPGPIDDLVQSSRLILPVIRHCIADLLVSTITPSEAPQYSLLPPRLATESSRLNGSSITTNDGFGMLLVLPSPSS